MRTFITSVLRCICFQAEMSSESCLIYLYRLLQKFRSRGLLTKHEMMKKRYET